MEKTLKTLYCRHCGSTNLLIKAWININTHDIDEVVTDDYYVGDKVWCENCLDHHDAVTIKQLWNAFLTIPVNDEDKITERFLCFEWGDDRSDVLQWFDERCPNGLAVDLMGEQPKQQ